jgi:ATP-dependent exoDNAse (exonuclease V) beta subunit
VAAGVAARVRELLDGGRIVEAKGTVRNLQPEDIAVLTPHFDQASAVAARLADLPGVRIGTANQVQGIERGAVVVVHP